MQRAGARQTYMVAAQRRVLAMIYCALHTSLWSAASDRRFLEPPSPETGISKKRRLLAALLSLKRVVHSDAISLE
jgi:hypothetical protein